MNKTKKTLLMVSSILSIIGFAGMVLLAGFMFICGAVSSEKLIKESYMEDPEYTYMEFVDGSYMFTSNDPDDADIVRESEIETIAKVTKVLFISCAIVGLAFSIAKLVLAIKILVGLNKNKYKKGCTIGLLTLSILGSNIAEAVLLIIAMCLSDKSLENTTGEDKQLHLEDIPLQ